MTDVKAFLESFQVQNESQASHIAGKMFLKIGDDEESLNALAKQVEKAHKAGETLTLKEVQQDGVFALHYTMDLEEPLHVNTCKKFATLAAKSLVGPEGMFPSLLDVSLVLFGTQTEQDENTLSSFEFMFPDIIVNSVSYEKAARFLGQVQPGPIAASLRKLDWITGVPLPCTLVKVKGAKTLMQPVAVAKVSHNGGQWKVSAMDLSKTDLATWVKLGMKRRVGEGFVATGTQAVRSFRAAAGDGGLGGSGEKGGQKGMVGGSYQRAW